MASFSIFYVMIVSVSAFRPSFVLRRGGMEALSMSAEGLVGSLPPFLDFSIPSVYRMESLHQKLRSGARLS